jgi:molybdenum-dependent DNA-binding transcriptional regulator ModE
MGDILAMSQKERHRKVILEGVKSGTYTLVDAAKRMKISYRQAKRIWKKYQHDGDIGLVHQNRGKQSNRGFKEDFKESVLNYYRDNLNGFGPTFAAEKLAKENLVLSHETLRQWLKAEGLWQQQRKRSPYRKRRERRKQFGDLLQMDGSHHKWFGPDGKSYCLMSMIDDATGVRLSILAEAETTQAAMELLKLWIERYGVPKSLYVDLKSVYVSPLELKSSDVFDTKGNVYFTHFNKACHKLDIEIIKAYSPQAKGRIERSHAVYQDRLVKEIQLQSLTTIDEVNHLLLNEFNDDLNQRFSVKAVDEHDAHRPASDYGDLYQIFCWETTRQVQNDWTISYLSQCYQIKKTTPLLVRPKAKVMVRCHLDGKLTIWYKDHTLPFKKVAERPKQTPAMKKVEEYTSAKRSAIAKKNKLKSPWSKYDLRLTKKQVSQGASHI